MQVELVDTVTSDGVPLDGYLRTPQTASSDIVVFHHGVGANFYRPAFFDHMGDALLEQGWTVLRVNNRGHDQAVMAGQRRLGAAFEIVDDCRHDITAWLDFAEQRGYRRMALWGHSLGAVKTVYFLSVQDDPRVEWAIASSPPRFSYEQYRASTEGPRFAAALEEAQRFVAAGEPDHMLDAVVPVVRRFSAGTYVDKYGPNARYDYLEHLPNVRKPLLLTLGSLEVDNISFAPLAERGPSFSAQWPRIEYRLIDNADHSYATRTHELWSAVSEWLVTTRAPA
jgi:pimeloyl-ACP methyl ester carboxylesterase